MTIRGAQDLTLSDRDYQALEVLELGCSSKASSTIVDEHRGLRAISHSSARTLLAGGYAAEVTGWNAVELTDLGRQALEAWRCSR